MKRKKKNIYELKSVYIQSPKCKTKESSVKCDKTLF